MENFDQSKWDNIKRIEFLRRGGPHWMFDFTEEFKELKDKEAIDKIWQLIKNKTKKAIIC